MNRLFLAIDLPEDIKSSLDKQLTPLKQLYPQFSWVMKNNYHITLHFFGNTDNVKQIKEKLSDIIFGQPKFYFYTTNINLFMSGKIVIYLNFKREKNLEKLAELLNNREFITHLTLAKTKIPSKQQYLVLKKRLERTKIDLEFTATKVILFESVTSGKNPVYKKIAQYKLG